MCLFSWEMSDKDKVWETNRRRKRSKKKGEKELEEGMDQSGMRRKEEQYEGIPIGSLFDKADDNELFNRLIPPVSRLRIGKTGKPHIMSHRELTSIEISFFYSYSCYYSIISLFSFRFNSICSRLQKISFWSNERQNVTGNRIL